MLSRTIPTGPVLFLATPKKRSIGAQQQPETNTNGKGLPRAQRYCASRASPRWVFWIRCGYVRHVVTLCLEMLRSGHRSLTLKPLQALALEQ